MSQNFQLPLVTGTLALSLPMRGHPSLQGFACSLALAAFGLEPTWGYFQMMPMIKGSQGVDLMLRGHSRNPGLSRGSGRAGVEAMGQVFLQRAKLFCDWHMSESRPGSPAR